MLLALLAALLLGFLALGAIERHLQRVAARLASVDAVEASTFRLRLRETMGAHFRALGAVLVQPCACPNCAAIAAAKARGVEAQCRLVLSQVADTSLELDARRVLEWAQRANAAGQVQLQQASAEAFGDMLLAAQASAQASVDGGAN